MAIRGYCGKKCGECSGCSLDEKIPCSPDCKNLTEDIMKGRDVPERIGNTAIAIMRRFTITGTCDGMYICNVIAYENGIGDGQGNFTGDGNALRNIPGTARFLQHAYGCNIYQEDIEELEEILATSAFDKSKATHGIQKYIAECRKEKKFCDELRTIYLNNQILTAQENLRYICY